MLLVVRPGATRSVRVLAPSSDALVTRSVLVSPRNARKHCLPLSGFLIYFIQATVRDLVEILSLLFDTMVCAMPSLRRAAQLSGAAECETWSPVYSDTSTVCFVWWACDSDPN